MAASVASNVCFRDILSLDKDLTCSFREVDSACRNYNLLLEHMKLILHSQAGHAHVHRYIKVTTKLCVYKKVHTNSGDSHLCTQLSTLYLHFCNFGICCIHLPLQAPISSSEGFHFILPLFQFSAQLINFSLTTGKLTGVAVNYCISP